MCRRQRGRGLETTSDHTGEALSYFPDLEDYNTGPWSYLDHISQAKRALSVPVIASLNGITPGGWVGTSLAATTGVHTGLDAAKVLLAGANVAMMTSALLRNGPEHLAVVERELRAVMAEHDHDSVAQLRGSMSRVHMPDPAGFERANYVRTLMSWSSRAQVSPGQATTDQPGG